MKPLFIFFILMITMSCESYSQTIVIPTQDSVLLHFNNKPFMQKAAPTIILKDFYSANTVQNFIKNKTVNDSIFYKNLPNENVDNIPIAKATNDVVYNMPIAGLPKKFAAINRLRIAK